MPGFGLRGKQLACLLLLSAIVLLPGLGSSRRLTYHEAFVAQGAQEMLSSGNWAYPTIGGLPWLEKPPLPWWLVVALGYNGRTVNELVARLPSVLGAIGVVLGVAVLATRHYGPSVGLLAGCIQATTGWIIMRGRLAEADILLVCLVTWTIVAFDHLLVAESPQGFDSRARHWTESWRLWRWVFFILLGITSVVKGIGFGAALVLSVISGLLVWRRDWVSLRRLYLPAGWVLAGVIALAWPMLMIRWHGSGVLTLWAVHMWDRLIQHSGSGAFAAEPGWEYGLTILAQGLPWTPLAMIGLGLSMRASLEHWHKRWTEIPGGGRNLAMLGDQLLWVWAFVPLGFLSLAPVKNAHYALSAQVPWSIWAALAMVRIGKLVELRGHDYRQLVQLAQAGFAIIGLGCGLGSWLLGSYFGRRDLEWAFYQAASRQVPPDMPVILLYDDWDREPYKTPFGGIPHDLAVRLFYLGRPASWCRADQLCLPVGGRSVAVIGRDRDRSALERLGQVELVAQSPQIRFDRTYSIFRLTPSPGNFTHVGQKASRELH